MAEQKNINAAYRLLTLLQTAVAQPPKLQQVQVWSSVFHVERLSGRQQKQAVAHGIDLMYKQLDRVVEQLRNLKHPEDSYRPLVTNIENNISYEMLNHPWQDYRARLNPALYPLTIIANTLPDEENVIDPAELRTLLEELDKLERSLSEHNLADELRSFVHEQVEIIRRAIWEYPIRGVQAFQDAMVEGARSAWVNEDVIAEHEDDEPVKQAKLVWTRVKQVVDTTIKIGSLLTAGHRIYQLMEGGLHIAKHVGS